MPEIRKNPIIEEFVIIAPERADRPNSTIKNDNYPNIVNKYDKDCPFCEGNEFCTPEEVFSIRKNNTYNNQPGWDLRVFKNKYSALNLSSDLVFNNENNFKKFAHAYGIAEVIVETPYHSEHIANYSEEKIYSLFNTFKNRYAEHSRHNNIKYISMFKNHGRNAGASLPHQHSQIISMPIVPPAVSKEIIIAENYYNSSNNCIFCELINYEVKENKRIIYQNDSFISFVPYAARFPYEIWILPKQHEACFETISSNQLKLLSENFRNCINMLNNVLKYPDFNFYIHTSPLGDSYRNYYHWHIEITPRISQIAGFELGTGMHINTSLPEENAEQLRYSNVFE